MKTAKIFKNGQSQAVRLPKEFRFSRKQVFINRIGNVVVLLAQDDAMSPLLQGIHSFTDDFMATRDQGGFEARGGVFG